MNFKKISKIISTILLCTMVLYTTPVFAYTKDETVYSKVNNKGNKYETIVSTHLQNDENEELIKDMTDLINIKNTNGEEKFEQKENSLTWNSEKHDIYYQGESNKDLPIEIKIKYNLDGKDIEPQEIVGKSGKVKITIEYNNKDEHIVKINGRDQKMFTPFVVVAGTIIDNEKNKNIEITNGKIINDGTRTIALGMAMPGLQESLDIKSDKLEIPNSIEITMDTTNFEMNSIMNLVTPKVLEEKDLNIFDDMEKIYSQVNILSSSSKQIEAGANTLKEGTSVYSGKMKEFETAMGQITNGMKSANSNYTKINDGIKAINTNNGQLNAGAKQVADGVELVGTNLNTVNQKLEEILTGTKGLKNGEVQLIAGIDGIIKKLDSIPVVDNTSKLKELNQLVNTNKSTINSLTQVNKGLNAKYNVAEEETEKAMLKAQIDSNNSIIMLLKANIKAEEETINILKATDNSQMIALKEGLKQVKLGLNSLSSGTDKLTTGIDTLKTGTITLETKTGELSKGAKTLYEGTSKMSAATKTLQNGSNEMKKGLTTLDDSGVQILEANTLLTKGAEDLSDGVNTLSAGISKFNKDAIEKICNYINGDLKDLTTRIEKLEELSKEYNNFTMLEDGVNGNVKFIMIVDSLTKETIKEIPIIDTKRD